MPLAPTQADLTPAQKAVLLSAVPQMMAEIHGGGDKTPAGRKRKRKRSVEQVRARRADIERRRREGKGWSD